MKIKKDDKVVILSGKDKGKSGKVIDMIEKKRVVVEGLNLVIKHMKPRKQGEKGQRIQYPSPLDLSKVALVCPKCSKKTKVGFTILPNNKKKMRICKKCKEIID